jgi:hypothetical protein
MKFSVLFFYIIPITPVLGQDPLRITSLSYPESIFNSDTCCWRKLSAAGYDEDAGQLILTYYQQNKTIANKQALLWHAGQCFAMAGEKELALQFMKKTYSSFYRWFGGEDGRTWYYYAHGTVAFLDREKETLTRMIANWERRYPQDANYQALLELQQHWDLPYKAINKRI